ncbi:kinase-like domain-containing protein [Cytidiella melzeri]|nr:kinase-like domain-containing protein [Cytidiella melzeri]
MSFLPSALKSFVRGFSKTSNDALFHYTSGRFLYNEAEQLAVRRVEFNVTALKRVAAQAAGASHCTRITKTHEGSYNKIYLLEFDNSTDLIAKIPTKLIPPFYTTASEVATMDYARTVLDLPVPRVLAWNARADSDANPVGIEYILMENVEGDPLDKRWDQITGKMAKEVMDQVVALEQRFTRFKFSQIGSLYYREDVGEALQSRPLYSTETDVTGGNPDKYRIGPLVDWDVWRGSRAALQVDRGPWPDPLSYIRGSIRVEQEWLRRFAPPYKPPFHQWPNGSPQEHVDLLERLYVLLSNMVPPPEICGPVLWHIDLHGGNIVLDSTDPTYINGIIDWQSVSIRPLYMQATFAKFVVYHGEDVILEPGLVHPKLRVPLEESPQAEHARLELELRNARLQKSYEGMMRRFNPWSHAVHAYPFISSVRTPIERAARTWYEGSDHLRECIFQIVQEWDEIAPGVPLPVQVEQAEWDRHKAKYARREKYDTRVKQLQQDLGLDPDGWVSNERFEDVKALNVKLMAGWDEEAEGGPYPFQDGAPSWFVNS